MLRLKILRNMANPKISQVEIADHIKSSSTMISGYETGRYDAPGKVCIMICDFLKQKGINTSVEGLYDPSELGNNND